MKRMAMAALSSCLLAACGSGVEPTGLDVPAPGVYAGTLQELRSVGVVGTVRLDTRVRGSDLAGAFDLTLHNLTERGSFVGTASGGRFELVLTRVEGDGCGFGFRGITEPGDRLRGTWTTLGCSVLYSGSFEARRQ